MGFEFIKKLPTPAEIKQQYPVPEKVAQMCIRDRDWHAHTPAAQLHQRQNADDGAPRCV